MKNSLILLFIIIFYTEVFAKTEVLFTPSVKCENKIEQLIDNTEYNLDIVVYSINNNKIVDAIERAYERGIKISTSSANARHNSVFPTPVGPANNRQC